MIDALLGGCQLGCLGDVFKLLESYLRFRYQYHSEGTGKPLPLMGPLTRDFQGIHGVLTQILSQTSERWHWVFKTRNLKLFTSFVTQVMQAISLFGLYCYVE